MHRRRERKVDVISLLSSDRRSCCSALFQPSNVQCAKTQVLSISKSPTVIQFNFAFLTFIFVVCRRTVSGCVGGAIFRERVLGLSSSSSFGPLKILLHLWAFARSFLLPWAPNEGLKNGRSPPFLFTRSLARAHTHSCRRKEGE